MLCCCLHISCHSGISDGDMSMNSSLNWLRGGIGEQGIQSLNFQRFGASPYMQPRLDSSMLGLQPDIYHTMMANSLHDPLPLDPSKVPSQLLMQLQQNLPNVSSSSIQNQILQQSNSQPNFVQNFQENVVSQAQILQQQLDLQQQFKEQQSQQLQQHEQRVQQSQQLQQHEQRVQQSQQLQQHEQRVQQSQQLHQHFQDQQNKTTIQNGPHLTPLQSIASTSQLHNFSDLIGTHVPSPNTSSMPQSLLTSFSNEGASHMVNWHGPHNTSVPHSSSSKRVALNPQLPPKVSQFGLLHPEELGQKIPDLSALLPPFPGREFLGLQGASDSHNKIPFGVATDSSSAMMLNGLSSSFRNSGDENGSLSMPYATPAFVSPAGAEFPRNSEMASSSCVDESGYLHTSENADHTNPPPGSFVKVS